MGGQSEELCSLLLHTEIDKAIVPALTSDGYVLLGQASCMLNSDMKSEGPAKIYFDSRLSTDSFMPGECDTRYLYVDTKLNQHELFV